MFLQYFILNILFWYIFHFHLLFQWLQHKEIKGSLGALTSCFCYTIQYPRVNFRGQSAVMQRHTYRAVHRHRGQRGAWLCWSFYPSLVITAQMMYSFSHSTRYLNLMLHFHRCYPLKGYTSSRGTWDQLSRQMTSLLCSDQMFQMEALTCLSSGKQVFLAGSAVPERQPWVPTQSSAHVELSPPVTLHCPFYHRVLLTR